ncbi:MAG: LptA/OstA family protein [Armatimonadota bacterium]|nr:LptA/OstA family protein [Armatimonadota bacterium]
MRRIAIIILICCAAVLMTGVVDAAKPAIRYDLTGWRTLDMTSSRIVASGGAPVVTSSDGKLRLLAGKIVLTLTQEKNKKNITTAEAIGAVRLSIKQDANQTIQATCARAVIRPAQDRAELSGNVIVKSWDKKRYSAPTTLTGDTVTLYLKDRRIVASSSPSKSSFSANPK